MYFQLVYYLLLLSKGCSCFSDFQKTSTSFIDRMSREYIEYLDIVQPVQVAVYEMKLGLSLVLSSILKESFLKKLLEVHGSPKEGWTSR